MLLLQQLDSSFESSFVSEFGAVGGASPVRHTVGGASPAHRRESPRTDATIGQWTAMPDPWTSPRLQPGTPKKDSQADRGWMNEISPPLPEKKRGRDKAAAVESSRSAAAVAVESSRAAAVLPPVTTGMWSNGHALSSGYFILFIELLSIH